MGMLKRMAAESASVKRRPSRRRPKNGSLGVSISGTKGTAALLAAFPIALRQQVLTRANEQAAKVVIAAAKGNLAGRRSDETGTQEKQSKKVREKRRNVLHLEESLAMKTIESKNNALTMVGHSRPDGNHSHLEEFSHWQPLWGSGSVMRSRARPYLRPAGDETKEQQKRAAVQYVNRYWYEV